MSDSGGSSSSLEVKEYPSAYGTTDYGKSSELAKILESMLGKSSKITDTYKSTVLNPRATPDTISERHLINSILDMTSGREGIKGSSPSTGYNEVAKAIFPNLVDMRKSRTGELAKAKASELTQNQTVYQTLLELIGLAMPQLVGGYNQRGKGGSNNAAMISAFGNLASQYAGSPGYTRGSVPNTTAMSTVGRTQGAAATAAGS